MAEPKKDCFAYTEAAGGTCMALNGLYCVNQDCTFYKTKEQHKKDVEKAEKRGVRQ